MATRDLTQAEFTEVTTGDGIVLVDFWADWCVPCKRFAPTYEKVSTEFPDVVFAKVDTEAEQALAIEYGIQAIPTLMAVRDGVVVYQRPGMMSESGLKSLITQIQELDMDEVRSTAA